MELSSNLVHHIIEWLTGKQEYCWEDLLGEVVRFECRMRHHEEGKGQVSPVTVVHILWSILFAELFQLAGNGVFPHWLSFLLQIPAFPSSLFCILLLYVCTRSTAKQSLCKTVISKYLGMNLRTKTTFLHIIPLKQRHGAKLQKLTWSCERTAHFCSIGEEWFVLNCNCCSTSFSRLSFV